MKFSLKTRVTVAFLIVASALPLALSGANGGASTPGGTITFAEAPGAAPTWIFPYTGYQDFSRCV